MKSRSVNIVNLISKQFNKKHLLVSFSGGQDSITLLILLAIIQSQNSLNLNILWNNHLWHKDSFFIARHVLKLSCLLKLTAHNVITTTSVKTELQARQWRSKASRRLQMFYKYHNIVQAHSGTDKIETLLLNLFRGTGNTCPFYSTDFLLNFSQNQKRTIKHVNTIAITKNDKTIVTFHDEHCFSIFDKFKSSMSYKEDYIPVSYGPGVFSYLFGAPYATSTLCTKKLQPSEGISTLQLGQAYPERVQYCRPRNKQPGTHVFPQQITKFPIDTLFLIFDSYSIVSSDGISSKLAYTIFTLKSRVKSGTAVFWKFCKSETKFLLSKALLKRVRIPLKNSRLYRLHPTYILYRSKHSLFRIYSCTASYLNFSQTVFNYKWCRLKAVMDLWLP